MNDPPNFPVLDEFDDRLLVRSLLRTFADPITRYTVYYLREEPTVSLAHLAEVVTGWVNASTGSIATPADRDRIRTLLYHVHLPVLDSLGVVEFDPRSRTVVLDELSPTMESFVEWIRQLEGTDGDDGTG